MKRKFLFQAAASLGAIPKKNRYEPIKNIDIDIAPQNNSEQQPYLSFENKSFKDSTKQNEKSVPTSNGSEPAISKDIESLRLDAINSGHYNVPRAAIYTCPNTPKSQIFEADSPTTKDFKRKIISKECEKLECEQELKNLEASGFVPISTKALVHAQPKSSEVPIYENLVLQPLKNKARDEKLEKARYFEFVAGKIALISCELKVLNRSYEQRYRLSVYNSDLPTLKERPQSELMALDIQPDNANFYEPILVQESPSCETTPLLEDVTDSSYEEIDF